MAFEGPQAGDIRATLALSQAEAQVGSSRTLTLPGGRRITVPIRAGIRDGEEIRLKGQGEETWPGGPVGDLILTVSLPTVEQYAQQPFYGDNPGSPTDFIAPPPLPPFATYASPSGATYPATGSYPNYPEQAQAQEPLLDHIPIILSKPRHRSRSISITTRRPLRTPRHIRDIPRRGSRPRSCLPLKNAEFH